MNIFDKYIIIIPWEDAILSLVIIILALLLRKIFTRYILKIISKLITRTKTNYDDKLLKAFEKPIRAFIIILGLYLAIKVFNQTPIDPLWLSHSFRSALIILIASGLYRSAPIFTEIGSRLRFQSDEILTKFLSRTIQFIIVALALAVTAEEWGYNVNGFVAGLGLGGLAVALAAKDTLANLFAGFVIITGKPFSIDDWIMTPSVEGTVEDITLRSTKIRTFAQALVTVPNANLANEAITNWTQMGKRQIYFKLRISYRTSSQQLENCVDQIKELLHTHPDTHNDTIMVSFDSFGENGFEILLYFFTNTTRWAEYLDVKQDVNLKIMEILERENVEVALPSQSVYFGNPLEVKSESSPLEESPQQERQRSNG